MAESLWNKVGVVAGVVAAVTGVVAAVAAVGVFVIPPADRETDGGNPTSSVQGGGTTGVPTSPSPSGSGSGSASQPSTATSGASTDRLRHLADLPIVQGAGLVQVVSGSDLLMRCGSNQSDDRFREVEYALPGPYATFTTEVAVQGTADPETTVGVELFVRERIDRSDRLRRAATVVAHPGQVKALSTDVVSATALVLRLSCGSSASRVRYADPRVHG